MVVLTRSKETKRGREKEMEGRGDKRDSESEEGVLDKERECA